jgi:Protein of unknown function (DUF5818)
MRKTYLITAILLLSAVWAVAQGTPSTPPSSTTPDTTNSQPSPQSTSPSSTLPSQQPTAPDSTATTQTSTDSSTSIEGCLNGSAGNWTLTDQSGKTWQLAGDTAKLGDHVGHQVRISGSDNSGSATSPSSGAGSSASTPGGSSSGSQPTFTVRKVKMISSSCSTTK